MCYNSIGDEKMENIKTENISDVDNILDDNISDIGTMPKVLNVQEDIWEYKRREHDIYRWELRQCLKAMKEILKL